MYSTIISVDALKENYNSDSWIILDCRFDLASPANGEALYHENHIEDAQYINLNLQLSGEITASSGRHPLPSISNLTQALSQAGIGEGKQVVVYDDCSGATAARAWWLLQWLGHTSVAVLDGGIQAWQQRGYALSQQVHQASAVHFVRHSSHFAVLSTEQLCSAQYQLIDARAAARFTGEIEPIDSVAGHVPGAINRPFTENLTELGLFKARQVLAQEFTALAAESSVHMCGSGVTACHNILAMSYAGLEPGKLYVGSWSEWIRDPARLIAIKE